MMSAEPVPTRLLTVEEDRRLNPSDFDEFIPAPPADWLTTNGNGNSNGVIYGAGTERESVGEDKLSTFTLRADANPPANKFSMLCEIDPKFRLSFDHQRVDLQDQSASSYDLALATRALMVGWTAQEIVDLLIAHRRQHGEDLKLREDYYRRTLNVAAKSTTMKTGQVPAPTRAATVHRVADDERLRFPIEVLPDPIRRYCEELAAALPVAIDMVALPVLAVAAHAIGAQRMIELKPGWREGPNLYCAVVAPSGSLKSPALAGVCAPVRARQRKLTEEYKHAMKAYEADLIDYQREVALWKKEKRFEMPEKPEPPTRGRTWTADVTVERLGGLLEENPSGLIVVRDELSAWVKSLNAYKNGRGADREFYLSAWSGAAAVADRQGKEPVLIDRPILSVVGCVPPDVLPDLDDEGGKEDGFLYRILFSYPEPVPVRWSDKTVSEETRRGYENLIESLYELKAPVEEQQRDGDGSIVLTLTAIAQPQFALWHDEHCQETECPSLPAGLRGFYSKMKGIGGRLALIHALCMNPDARRISADSVAAAADLIEYFKAHAAKISPLLVRKRLTPHDRCEKEILRHLRGGRALTQRELQRSGNANAKLFHEVLGALIDTGRVVEVEKPGERGIRKAVRLAEEEPDAAKESGTSQ
jgi:hypothetical protein